MAEKLSKETEQHIENTLNAAVVKLADIQSEQIKILTEQLRTIQMSFTLLQRQIDVLNERVAVTTDHLLKHIEQHE